tara:strand:- start:235 stop:510 length:276 start_codon:yes stop_codon:yes gene_type:complete
MPTDAARDIVNALFAGNKDLSDYVATGMNARAVDAIETQKKEIGSKIFRAVPEDGPENTEQPDDANPEASAETETETETEEPKNETDQGGD